ncbi:hypothetical protein [Methylomonas sp. CM2]|uniref:hypothetical protein n=1 Tax=Methylomonas sp. CM2 TaxID=3417647 RepID=UPI003CFAD9B2
MTPNQPNNADRTEIADLCAVAQYVEQIIAAEHQWISNRLSWFYMSQTFCLATHAVLVTAQGVHVRRDFEFLLWAMPLFGLVSSVIVFFSAKAAESVVRSLAEERARLTRRINAVAGASIPLIGASRPNRQADLHWTHWAGALPLNILPPSLALIWIVLLIFRFSCKALCAG